MRAIAAACERGEVPARVAIVISPLNESPALESARLLGLNAAVVATEPTASYGQRLAKAIGNVDWVCLAGYMRLLPREVLQAFPDRILNIHPALLPKFGGQGMFGMHVHRAVIAAAEKESGCTVHFVNEVYDDGEIILQRRIPVHEDDTAESLASRVLEQENMAYPEALSKVINAHRD